MGRETVVKLLERVGSDEALRRRLREAGSPEEWRRRVTDAGFDLTPDDLDLLRARRSGELSDAELERVAGGASSSSPSWDQHLNQF